MTAWQIMVAEAQESLTHENQRVYVSGRSWDDCVGLTLMGEGVDVTPPKFPSWVHQEVEAYHFLLRVLPGHQVWMSANPLWPIYSMREAVAWMQECGCGNASLTGGSQERLNQCWAAMVEETMLYVSPCTMTGLSGRPGFMPRADLDPYQQGMAFDVRIDEVVARWGLQLVNPPDYPPIEEHYRMAVRSIEAARHEFDELLRLERDVHGL